MGDFKKLEDYGIIGNLESSALIAQDGSVDWLCFPFVDSPSIFAGLLDPDRGGAFRIGPKGKYGSNQSYVSGTNVLETTFHTPSGSAIVTDFMPVLTRETGHEHRVILRKITCTRGNLELEILFQPKFNYGRGQTELARDSDGVLASYGDEKLFLQGPSEMKISGDSALGEVRLESGKVAWFALQYGEISHRTDEECDRLLDQTVAFWTAWLDKSSIARPVLQAPWHDLVIRSALVLKLLNDPRTGALMAAPTTSLPESIGGIRNWDYRYSWIRDASFTVQAFEQLGYVDEALSYFHWLKNVSYANAKAEGTANIKIAYTFEGKEIPAEEEIESLRGYLDSRPVRCGNAAFSQDQLDIYGEIISTFYQARKHQKRLVTEYWSFIKDIAEHVCDSWAVKDSGIWEFRFARRHLTHSKLMCWVALALSIKMARKDGLEAPLDKWSKSRDDIRKAILDKGFSRRLNSFVQAFDYEVLDATSLLIPILGFLPPDDPRVKGTIKAVSERLSDDGLLRRYEGDDGLPGQEGVFVICSFWLVQALALAGEIEKAQQEFFRILKYKSPLGLFAEEIDPRSSLLLGNYPQAFSHIGLINAALYLGKVQQREKPGPRLIGAGNAEDGEGETEDS